MTTALAVTNPADIVQTFGPYIFTKTALLVNGTPTFEQHDAVGVWIRVVKDGSPWWFADWLAYGQGRADFAERLSQVMEIGDYTRQSARNLKYVGENVPPSRRNDALDITHHMAVASLAPAAQVEVLAAAANEHWSVAKVKAHVKGRKLVAAGGVPEYWLVVKCTSEADQQALADRMEMEGRAVKPFAKDS